MKKSTKKNAQVQTPEVKAEITKEEVVEQSENDKIDAFLKNEQRWKIWVILHDQSGATVGYGVYPVDYAHKSSAERRAKKLSADNPNATWIVSQTNPWKEAQE